MKRIFILLFSTASFADYAQPKILTQAIVTTKTTITAPEGDDAPQGSFSTSTDGGDQVRVMRFGGDGETKTTTWLKNDLVKTFSESEMGRTTVIRDNSKKITTTMMEMMGRKNAFYATDEDQKEMAKRMDSMMRTRVQNTDVNNTPAPPTYKVEYIEESKKISGYSCKKALIIATRSNGKSDTTTVWYCPEFKLQNLASTGGSMGGFGGFNVSSGPNSMELLNGFPMQYERSMPRGRTMTVQVTKLVIDKEVADKEFEIPKDVEVKAMKDMQQEGGGQRFIMRAGG